MPKTLNYSPTIELAVLRRLTNDRMNETIQKFINREAFTKHGRFMRQHRAVLKYMRANAEEFKTRNCTMSDIFFNAKPKDEGEYQRVATAVQDLVDCGHIIAINNDFNRLQLWVPIIKP